MRSAARATGTWTSASASASASAPAPCSSALEAYNLFNHANLFPNTDTADVSSFTDITGSTRRQPPRAARRASSSSEPVRLYSLRGPGAGPPFSCTEACFRSPSSLASSRAPSRARRQRRQPAKPGPPAVARVTWAQAQPIVNRLEEALPESLRAIPAAERAQEWPEWIDGQRRALEGRIAQGDVDSVVNLMLFGTSFTTEPRITARLLSDLNQKWTAGDRSVQETLARHYQQRAADLVNAVWAAAGTDARLQDVKRVLTARGHSLDTATGQRAAIQDLLASVARVREEAAALAEELEALRAREGRHGRLRRTLARLQDSRAVRGFIRAHAVRRRSRRLRARRPWRAGRPLRQPHRHRRARARLRRQAGGLRLLRPAEPAALHARRQPPAVRPRHQERALDHHDRHQPARQRAPARRGAARD